MKTSLLPHQQRVIDKLKASGGLLVAHGVGSGKTLSSIASADALGLPIEAVVPAPLIENYQKEIEKHTGGKQQANVRSYEKAVRENNLNPNSLVVLDEAHRARNTNTAIAQNIAQAARNAKARLLLTGTPVYNQPTDIAPLLNAAAGKDVLPSNPLEFKKTFIGEKEIPVPLATRAKSWLFNRPIKSTVPTLINRKKLVDAAKGYVDVHMGQGQYFPSRTDENVNVEMTPEQLRVYDYHEGKLPWYLRAKIREGLPLDKQESQALNTFQTALRQTANTPRPYLSRMSQEKELENAPKIKKILEHITEMKNKDKNYRGVVYSNFLDAGISPMSRALQNAGIQHQVFTGDIPKKQRDLMVKNYNEGKSPLLLISGAGAEGLDLKGTKSIHLMEPHWNESKLDQVIGRGIRYKSHEHLPENERNVKVMKYFSTRPKPWLGAPAKSIDQYLSESAKQKALLRDEIMGALQEASNQGPLTRR